MIDNISGNDSKTNIPCNFFLYSSVNPAYNILMNLEKSNRHNAALLTFK